MIRNGRFLQTMKQVVEWIREHKRFAYLAPDYVVVGMPREEYDTLLAKKQRDFNYEMFADEISQLTDEQYQALMARCAPPTIEK